MRTIQTLTQGEIEDAALIVVRVDRDLIDDDLVDMLRDQVRAVAPGWKGALLVLDHDDSMEDLDDDAAAELHAQLSARLG
jgi:hypothetical protein